MHFSNLNLSSTSYTLGIAGSIQYFLKLMVDKSWFVFLRKKESLVLCPAVAIINLCASATFQNVPVFGFLKNDMIVPLSGIHNSIIKEKWG